MMGAMDPVLVLLHGFTQTRQSWRRTAQALAPRYRALVPDLPGHGQAEHRTPSFDACAAYVRALAPARDLHARRLLDGRPDRAPLRAHARPLDRHPARARRARARASRTRRSAPRAARPTLRSRTASRRSTSRPSRANGARQPLFADQPPRVAAGAHADRLRNTPAGLAAALRGPGHRGDGAAVGSPAVADDPRHADRRRARREVPRARDSAMLERLPNATAGDDRRRTAAGPTRRRNVGGSGRGGADAASPTSPGRLPRRPPRSRRPSKSSSKRSSNAAASRMIGSVVCWSPCSA